MDWLEKQPHLPKVEEFMVIQFYNCSDYSLQRTKELIDTHYAFRNEAAELFTGRGYGPPKFSHSFWDITYMFDLPDHTKDGYRLIYAGFRDTTPSKFHLEHALAVFIKNIQTVIMERGSCEGYAFVFDMEGMCLSHLATVTVSLLRKFMFFAQDAVPLKVRQVNVINANSLIEKIMFLIKPFLSKELFEMITIDADMDTFFKRVPKKLIPRDLGGEIPHTREELTNVFASKVDKWDEVVQTEFQTRSTKSRNINDASKNTMTMTGSFKKLDLD